MMELHFKSFLPEVFFSITLLWFLIFNSNINNKTVSVKYIREHLHSKSIFYQAAWIFLILFLILLNQEYYASSNIYVITKSTQYVKIFVLFISLGLLNGILLVNESRKINFIEFYVLFFLAILASFLMISQCDLIFFYLTAELQALSFYVLAAILRSSASSNEAGLKYYLAGSFITCLFLLGISFLYYSNGSVSLFTLKLFPNIISIETIFPFLNDDFYKSFIFLISGFNFLLNNFYYISLFLILVLFLSKLGCAPFHFWIPDTYSGAPLSSTILFSVLPKIPLVYSFLCFVISLGVNAEVFFLPLIFCGGLSVLVGTLYAFQQTCIKKIFIYSSISQIGYFVCGVGLICNHKLLAFYNEFICTFFTFKSSDLFLGFISQQLFSINIVSFVITFFFIYILTSLIFWNHIALYDSFLHNYLNNKNMDNQPILLTDLSNFVNCLPLGSFNLFLILFSFSSIPPLLGFFAKFGLFKAFIFAKSFLVNFIGCIILLVSSMSVFYNIRIIKVLFFEPTKNSKNLAIFGDVLTNDISAALIFLNVLGTGSFLGVAFNFDFFFFVGEFISKDLFLII